MDSGSFDSESPQAPANSKGVHHRRTSLDGPDAIADNVHCHNDLPSLRVPHACSSKGFELSQVAGLISRGLRRELELLPS